MSEEAKMYTCSWCGKPTPNYREYLHPMAGILGESGYSVCDECLRGARIEREWENEQSVKCPACGMSNSIAWGSMDLPPFRQAVAMLADSWNSR